MVKDLRVFCPAATTVGLGIFVCSYLGKQQRPNIFGLLAELIQSQKFIWRKIYGGVMNHHDNNGSTYR